MSGRESILACLLWTASSVLGLGASPEFSAPAPASLALFERKIRPVLVDHCYACHSERAGKAEGALRLDTRESTRRGGEKGPVVVPGAPQESRLIQFIRENHLQTRNPPRAPLPPTTVADFEEWVRMGAPDPRESAALAGPDSLSVAGQSNRLFQPVQMPAIPKGVKAEWVRTPIDSFLANELERNRLRAPETVNRSSWLRRVTFTLIGLPPTPQEVDAFLADGSTNAFALVVDRLLASPQFGEHWARGWLEAMHYADLGVAGPDPSYEDGWRYRDYVIQSLNEDKPYDSFVREQLAGDLLPAEDDEQSRQQLVGTGFLVVGNPYVLEIRRPKLLIDVADDQVDVTSRVFLGLSVSCARCHDHKSEPISMRDYYSMAGIFLSTATLAESTTDDPRRAPGRWQARSLATPEQRRELEEYEVRFNDLRDRVREARETRMEFPGDIDSSRLSGIVVDNLAADIQGAWKESNYSTNFVDKNYLHDGDANKGQRSARFVPDLPKESEYEVFVSYTPRANRATNVPVTVTCKGGTKKLTVDQTKTPTVDKVFVSIGKFEFEAGTNGSVTISNEGTKGFVVADAVRFVEKGASAPEKTDGHDPELAFVNYRQLEKELLELQAKRPILPQAMAVTDGKIRDSRIYVHGDSNAQGDLAPRGFPAAFGVPESTLYAITDESSGRLELAHWIANRDNPLTARVAVNRIWLSLFGKGLVTPPDDFGAPNAKVVDPELLEYLAARFVDLDWSRKKLIREIVLSGAFQLDWSKWAVSADLAKAGLSLPVNKRPVDAEALRDAMLAVSGLLDRTAGGSWKSEESNRDLFDAARNTQAVGKRRTVYLPVIRSARPELLREIDLLIGRSLQQSARETTATTAWSRFLTRCSRAWAEKLRGGATDDAQRINTAYREAFGRGASAAELAQAAEIIKAPAGKTGAASDASGSKPELAGWERLCRTLLTSPEFFTAL